MALQGRVQEQTNEAKNALEAFIYATRSKLADPWADYATDAERAGLSERLEKMEVGRHMQPTRLSLSNHVNACRYLQQATAQLARKVSTSCTSMAEPSGCLIALASVIIPAFCPAWM